jgi:hypothetical protein
VVFCADREFMGLDSLPGSDEGASGLSYQLARCGEEGKGESVVCQESK